MADHSVSLSERTWQAVQERAKEAQIDPGELVELILSDRVRDSDYVDDLVEELENDEAAEE